MFSAVVAKLQLHRVPLRVDMVRS